MVGHDNKRMNLHASLFTLTLQYIKEETRLIFHLKKAAALRGNGCNEICAKLLWRTVHTGSIMDTRG